MQLTDKLILTNEGNMELMSRYPDKYFDLAVVDPPYGIGVSKMAYLQENRTTVLQKNGTRLRPRKTIYKKSEWDCNVPDESYFSKLFRVSKNQIIWGIEYYEIPNISNGRIRWDKLVPENLSFKKYELAYCSLMEHEEVFTFLYSGFNVGKRLASPTTPERSMKKIERRIHPTQKPIALYKWILDRYAKPGDKILDTHLGSMSIAIACHDYDFELTGCELDSDYYKDGIKRVRNHIAQGRLF